MFDLVETTLERPFMYRALHTFTGLRDLHALLIRDVLRRFEAPDGIRVLDLGCGPGDTSRLFGQAHYTGIDSNPRYIALARHLAGPRTAFRLGDVTKIDPATMPPIDLVVAFGLIHHLDDAQAGALLAIVAAVLTPRGCIVTLDGCRRDGNSAAVQWMLNHDRGKHVRTEEQYLGLISRSLRLERVFRDPSAMHIPYSIVSIVAGK